MNWTKVEKNEFDAFLAKNEKLIIPYRLQNMGPRPAVLYLHTYLTDTDEFPFPRSSWAVRFPSVPDKSEVYYLREKSEGYEESWQLPVTE